jgi:two-component system, chemotaxis family, protein-glutamate methylesterase/glutaminase
MQTTATAGTEEVTAQREIDRAGKYLTFHLGNEEFGIQVLRVREIMGIQDITGVPQTPSFVKGVLPVIVISSLTQSSCGAALEALRSGAVEVLAKPGGPYSVGDLAMVLPAKIRAAARARLGSVQSPIPAKPSAEPAATPLPLSSTKILAIGASTGGVEAIESVVAALPESMPGILITQHIPAGFSAAFAERLNRLCRMEVREARHGDAVKPGLALIAPGNLHMLIRKSGAEYHVEIKDGPRVCYQRPSVDVMFASVAEAAGRHAIGVILTGMGSDGAQGMLRMKRARAITFAQDEATCVIYGMPREAVEAGAVDRSVPLHRMPGAILDALRAQ